MRFQVLQDGNGNNTGVFIPMQEWEVIRAQFPEIESAGEELPAWQKGLIDERLAFLEANPNAVKPIDGLLSALES